jgi:hypothetical protein
VALAANLLSIRFSFLYSEIKSRLLPFHLSLCSYSSNVLPKSISLFYFIGLRFNITEGLRQFRLTPKHLVSVVQTVVSRPE